MLTIVDTYLTTASEYNDDLENFTYFTGIKMYLSSAGAREYVAVKFVEASADCSDLNESAMLDPVSHETLRSVPMNSCSGLLNAFTVEDYSKQYKLCYQQANAPEGYKGFFSYDDMVLSIRHTLVSSTGNATYAIANYP